MNGTSAVSGIDRKWSGDDAECLSENPQLRILQPSGWHRKAKQAILVGAESQTLLVKSFSKIGRGHRTRGLVFALEQQNTTSKTGLRQQRLPTGLLCQLGDCLKVGKTNLRIGAHSVGRSPLAREKPRKVHRLIYAIEVVVFQSLGGN